MINYQKRGQKGGLQSCCSLEQFWNLKKGERIGLQNYCDRLSRSNAKQNLQTFDLQAVQAEILWGETVKTIEE